MGDFYPQEPTYTQWEFGSKFQLKIAYFCDRESCEIGTFKILRPCFLKWRNVSKSVDIHREDETSLGKSAMEEGGMGAAKSKHWHRI